MGLANNIGCGGPEKHHLRRHRSFNPVGVNPGPVKGEFQGELARFDMVELRIRALIANRHRVVQFNVFIDRELLWIEHGGKLLILLRHAFVIRLDDLEIERQFCGVLNIH